MALQNQTITSTYRGLSVLLPCYRIDTWLEEALNSTLAALPQQEAEIVIVMNNLEEDDIKRFQNTIQHSQFQSSQVKIINAGKTTLVGALNFGLLHCRYELIARMDQDDLMHPDRLHKQIRFLTENPMISLVGTFVRRVNHDGKAIAEVRYPTNSQQIRERLRYHNCFAHSSIMFRKSVVQEIGGYDHNYPQAEDYALYLTLAEKTELANLPEVLMDYRETPVQVSQQQIRTQIASTRALILISEFKLLNKYLPITENTHPDSRDLDASIGEVCRSLVSSPNTQDKEFRRRLRRANARSYLAGSRLYWLSQTSLVFRLVNSTGYLTQALTKSPLTVIREILYVVRHHQRSTQR